MRDLFFKKLYNLGVCSLLRMSKKNSITVLSLHRISEERDFFFNPIKPSTFVKLLEYCCKYYEITTFEDVHKPSAKAKLILSFDDGYYDFIEFAMPIMKKMGIPSNHNIVNSCANSNEVIWTQKLNDVFNFMKINDITNDNIIKTTSTFQGNWMQYYL